LQQSIHLNCFSLVVNYDSQLLIVFMYYSELHMLRVPLLHSNDLDVHVERLSKGIIKI
jgi:hypothetical protein